MATQLSTKKVGEKAKEFKYSYNSTDFEKQIVAEVFQQFRDSADNRNRNFENFDGLNLKQYIEESYRRFNTNIDERDDIEDWQAAVHTHFTRNKVNAILAKVVSVLPVAEVQARGDEDTQRSLILSNLYEYSEDADDYEVFVVSYLLESIVKGTGIGYEGHKYDVDKVRFIKGDGDDITVTDGEVRKNKLFAQVVKLEDFYPASVAYSTIKQMPRCFWRNVVTYQMFMNEYDGVFAKAKYVMPMKRASGEDEARPYYFDFVSDDVNDGDVEIIRKYDKKNDQFVILANGVWLNPIIGKSGIEMVSPLPFNHKELPFFDIRFELFSSDFFYGKSLPDKLKNLQDVLNVLTNMVLDQSFLTIFPPILTNGFDSIEDDYLRPGRRISIDTQGLPISQAYTKIDLGTPTGWHQWILEYTKNLMEEASVDKVSQGIAGAGDRTTAQEIRVAAEGVSAMLGLFGRFVKFGLKRKAYLRTKNICQFWMDSESPVVEQVNGQGSSEEASKAFNTFKVDNAILSDGKRGIKVIEFYKNKDEMPTRKVQKAKSKIYELSNNKKIEYVALTPEYIPNLEFDIKMVMSTKNENTKEAEKALALEKTRVYLSFFPDMVDKEELLSQLAEKFGDDPAKIISKDILNPQTQSDNNQMVDKGNSVNPTNNVAQNTVNGMMGGNSAGNEMTNLSNSMLG